MHTILSPRETIHMCMNVLHAYTLQFLLLYNLFPNLAASQPSYYE